MSEWTLSIRLTSKEFSAKKINWLALAFSENLNILRRHRAEIEEFSCYLVVENIVKFHTVGRNFSFMFGRAVS